MSHFKCSFSLSIIVSESIYFRNLLLYIGCSVVLKLKQTVRKYVTLFPHVVSVSWMVDFLEVTFLVGIQNVSRWRNWNNHSSNWSVQCGTRSTFLILCCKEMYIFFVYCSFMFMSVFHSSVQSVSCHSNNMHCGRSLGSTLSWFVMVLKLAGLWRRVGMV